MHGHDRRLDVSALWIAGLAAIVLNISVRSVRGDDRAASRPASVAPASAKGGPSSAEYQARRLQLIKALHEAGSGAGSAMLRRMIAHSGGERTPPVSLMVLIGQGNPGDDARFHQNNDFHYLTGIDEPFASAIVSIDSGEETLYLPARDRMSERYNGARLSPGPEAASKTGFGRVAASTEFLADLFRTLADRGDGRPSGSVVYLIEPEKGSESASGRNAWLGRMVRDGAPGARVESISARVHELRKTKSAAEVALLRRAIAATAEAQTAVARLAEPRGTENQLEGAILNAFIAQGANRAGFPSIVGSGLNSTVLHYGRNDATLGAGDLVVVDIGAEVEGYTADITRTYPVDGRFTPRQREVYQLVLDAQTGAAREVRAGNSTIGSLDLWVRAFFRSSPLRAKGEDGVDQTMDHFFPHGLGHHLGLDVHDVGDASKPLEPGQVFTIEPGLYLPLEGFGVRIEDDYLVTPSGVEKLSTAIPSSPTEIEQAMTQRRVGAGPPLSPPLIGR